MLSFVLYGAKGFAVLIIADLDILKIQFRVSTKGLENRLLGRKTRSQVLERESLASRVCELIRCKNTVEKNIPPLLDRFFQSLDLDDIDAAALDHRINLFIWRTALSRPTKTEWQTIE